MERGAVLSQKPSSASCQACTVFTKQLSEIYSSEWIQESSQIDVTNYLRNLGGTFVAMNRTNIELVKEMEERIIEPFQNFTTYDFLEMVDARKKVTATVAEYVAMRQKIEAALAPKKRKKKEPIDQAQLLQYESELERLRRDYEVNQGNLRNVLDTTHQKKETKLLKLMSDLSEIQYLYHGVSARLSTPSRSDAVWFMYRRRTASWGMQRAR